MGVGVGGGEAGRRCEYTDADIQETFGTGAKAAAIRSQLAWLWHLLAVRPWTEY